MGRVACGRWPRRLHARIRSCVGTRGGGFSHCQIRRMAERPSLTAAWHRRPRKSAVAPGPMLSEPLRRLTSAGRGTPGRDHGSRPCSQRAPRVRSMGKAGAVAACERVRLSSVGVTRPFLGRLPRARARPVLSWTGQRAGARGTERRVRMARPFRIVARAAERPAQTNFRRRQEMLDPRACRQPDGGEEALRVVTPPAPHALPCPAATA